MGKTRGVEKGDLMKFIQAFSLPLLLFLVMISVVSCVRIRIDQPSIETCQVPPFDLQPEVSHGLMVSHYVSSQISVEAVKDILKHATKVAQEGHGNQGSPEDVACNTQFTFVPQSPDDPIPTFPSADNPFPILHPLDPLPDGDIFSPPDFDAVIALNPPGVKIVENIYWCGVLGQVSGCSPTPGRSMIVDRLCKQREDGTTICFPGLEGALWLHEFGHNQGLPHRSPGERAVMEPNISSFNDRLNKCECLKYRKSSQP